MKKLGSMKLVSYCLGIVLGSSFMMSYSGNPVICRRKGSKDYTDANYKTTDSTKRDPFRNRFDEGAICKEDFGDDWYPAAWDVRGL